MIASWLAPCSDGTNIAKSTRQILECVAMLPQAKSRCCELSTSQSGTEHFWRTISLILGCPAEIHALLGENGAGKSTLVKIMYGLIQPSEGELRWMGQKIVLAGPSEARLLGIGMVFQHFSLFENLTVAENVALGLPPTESFAAISARLEETARVYGLPLDPKRLVWQLSVGEKQRIEIVRALMQNPKLLILDEPTAVLTPQEADQLFVVLGRLREEGRTMLYISHKLERSNGSAIPPPSCVAERKSRPAIRVKKPPRRLRA